MSEWIRDSDIIFQAAADATKRRLFRTGGSNIARVKVKFPDMEAEFMLKFKNVVLTGKILCKLDKIQSTSSSNVKRAEN